MTNENKVIRFHKTADKIKNRMIIPKFFVDKYGYDYYMEIYEDYIKLIPIKLDKENE